MKSFYLSFSLVFILFANAYGQFSALITITDGVTTLPVENVNVSLNDQTLMTNALGQVSFTNLSNGEYTYNFWADCYSEGMGYLTISGGNMNSIAQIIPATSNDVFFFIGSIMALTGSTVILTNNADFYQEFVTWDPWGGEVVAGVPYGEYTYSITTPCYETITGDLTVDCNEGQGTAVFADPAEATTNDVFFFVGSPMAITGSTIILSNNGDFYQEFVTSDPWGGEVIANVPYGVYSYTITTPCFETVTGNVSVSCNDGEGMIVSTEPAEATTNDVFFFIGEPMSISGATVTLTDGADFNESLTTGAPFGDIMMGVPYGDYTYTITADCYETYTGSITVDCNEGLGSVVAVNPIEYFIDNAVTVDGNVLTATPGEFNYQWVDCDNENAEIEGEVGQSFTATTDGNYAVIISNEHCSTTSACMNVNSSGIANRQPEISVFVYPNPFTGTLKIQTPPSRGTVSVKVISITGQVVLNQNFSGSELNDLDVANLSSGTYILKVTCDEGQFVTPIVKLY